MPAASYSVLTNLLPREWHDLRHNDSTESRPMVYLTSRTIDVLVVVERSGCKLLQSIDTADVSSFGRG